MLNRCAIYRIPIVKWSLLLHKKKKKKKRPCSSILYISHVYQMTNSRLSKASVWGITEPCVIHVIPRYTLLLRQVCTCTSFLFFWSNSRSSPLNYYPTIRAVPNLMKEFRQWPGNKFTVINKMFLIKKKSGCK
jgi:hypothetical protein